MGPSSARPYLWMLGGCFSFAFMGEFAHQLGPTCDWRLVALARSSLVLLFAAGLAWWAGVKLVLWRPRMLWLRSVTGSISLVCTFYAFSCLSPAEVLTLTNTFPIWVAVLSWPMLGARPAGSVWVAACCGVLGIVVMQYSVAPGQPSPHAGSVGLALPLALLAALCSAVAMLGLHRLGDIDPRAIVVHFSMVATGFTIVACLLGPLPPAEHFLKPHHLGLLLGVGVSATIGQLLLTRAFTEGQPARVSVVALSQIVFACGLRLAIGGEAPSGWTLAGMGLVMAPTAWMMAGRAAE